MIQIVFKYSGAPSWPMESCVEIINAIIDTIGDANYEKGINIVMMDGLEGE
jgi:hypothetical protein